MGENGGLYRVSEYLPDRLARELRHLFSDGHTVCELRLRGGGVSEVISDCGRFPLYARLTEGEISDILRAACRGSLYAFRDRLKEGYIPLPFGVRLGIVGEARYNGGEVVGVDSVRSLIFRIPTGKCDFAAELYSSWLTTGGESMIICAPPGGGKTTAIRALAGLIGRGRESKRVVVVDERCELNPSDYSAASVDVLQGYRRGLGVEVAVRTSSAEVLMVDEIASPSDADALRLAMGVGIPIIATAHGRSVEEAQGRAFIRELIRDGCFRHSVSIMRSGGGFAVSAVRRIEC